MYLDPPLPGAISGRSLRPTSSHVRLVPLVAGVKRPEPVGTYKDAIVIPRRSAGGRNLDFQCADRPEPTRSADPLGADPLRIRSATRTLTTLSADRPNDYLPGNLNETVT